MKKNSIIAIVIVVISFIGLSYFLVNNDQQEDNQTQPETSKPAENSTQADQPESDNSPSEQSSDTSAGEYIVGYQADKLRQKGDNWLFFHASWCPSCRQLKSDIQTKGVPAGVTVFEVDYDSSQDLRQRYGVTQQTTVVSVDAEGNKVKLFNPYSDPSLENLKQAFLE